MGWFQREIMRNHWILDVLPWRHAQINILNVSQVGGDHPKTSQEWSIGATSCCQNHGSTGWCVWSVLWFLWWWAIFTSILRNAVIAHVRSSGHMIWKIKFWMLISAFKFFGVYRRPEKFKWFTGENAEVCWTVRFSWDQFWCNSRFHAAQGELASQ